LIRKHILENFVTTVIDAKRMGLSYKPHELTEVTELELSDCLPA
jgi:hypothetical protein